MLLCPLCKMVPGNVYCIPVEAVGEVFMCHHVVERVVQVHHLVDGRSPEAPVGSSVS